MSNTKVSVIMPAYNAAKYIRRAIESVLAQTFKDFELIIVDDGSTDETGMICDEYAAKDPRVKVFRKSNGGVASARQVGIENATGEYSIHFDADDYAEPEMLEKMYQTATETEADIVIADFYVKFSSDRIIRFPQRINSEKSSEVLMDILEGKVFGALWHKLIKTSLYHDKHISFEPGINYCEDVLVDAKLMWDNQVKIIHHDGAYYTYCRDNNESITTSYSLRKFEERLHFFKLLCDLLNEVKFKHALEAEAWDIKMEAYRNGLLKLKDFDKIHQGSLLFIRYAHTSKGVRIKLMIYSIIHRVKKWLHLQK